MNRPKKNSTTKKMCPFFDEMCKGDGCMIYHEQFEKCGLDLMNFNMFALKEALKNLKPLTD